MALWFLEKSVLSIHSMNHGIIFFLSGEDPEIVLYGELVHLPLFCGRVAPVWGWNRSGYFIPNASTQRTASWLRSSGEQSPPHRADTWLPGPFLSVGQHWNPPPTSEPRACPFLLHAPCGVCWLKITLNQSRNCETQQQISLFRRGKSGFSKRQVSFPKVMWPAGGGGFTLADCGAVRWKHTFPCLWHFTCCLGPCRTEYGLQTSSPGVSWELVSNMESQESCHYTKPESSFLLRSLGGLCAHDSLRSTEIGHNVQLRNKGLEVRRNF